MAGRGRYDDIDFGVDVAGTARLPRPSIEAGTGAKRWTATIIVKEQANIEALESLVSIFDVKPAAGMVNSGTVNVQAGPGSKVLIFPGPDGSDLSAMALLESVTSSAAIVTHDAYRADVAFFLTTEPA